MRERLRTTRILRGVLATVLMAFLVAITVAPGVAFGAEGDIDITAATNWFDGDNVRNNRPASVTYYLYAKVGTSKMTEPTLVDTLVATQADGYTATFTGKPTRDSVSGETISYTVGTDDVPCYATSRKDAYTFSSYSGYTLQHQTNGSQPVTFNRSETKSSDYIRVFKVWDDDGHEDERPESVTVGLYEVGGDTPLAEVSITSANTISSYDYYAESGDAYSSLPADKTGVWAKNIVQYPLYLNGSAISAFEIREDAPSGYSASVGNVYSHRYTIYYSGGGDGADGIEDYQGQAVVVTNTYVGTPTPTPTRTQGWLRVNTDASVNTAVTYDAFKVFDASVAYDSNDGSYKGSHIEWESNAVQTAVMNFVLNASNKSAYDAWLAAKYGCGTDSVTNAMENVAQNACEWIALRITDSATDDTANTTPRTTKGDTFANQLATTLRNSGIAPTVIQPNTQTALDQGYYLVATTTSTIDDGEAGTAPVWAPVPVTGYEVTEKVSKPVFTKQVLDNTDVTDEYGKAADASTGQWLNFKLTTTLPANIRAFSGYPLQIVDVIPDEMTATIDTENGFSVTLNGTDITDKVTATLNSSLAVTVANVLDATTLGVEVTGNDALVVNYRAKLNDDAVKGSAGNPGTATLTYASDPMVSDSTAQLTSTATVFTYQIQVDKVDEITRLDVDGAQFAAQTTVGGTTYWVKSDGSLTTTEAERGIWTTNGGTLTIPGVDEGTYVITEVAAPTLYETLTLPLTVELNAVKDYANGALTSLSAAASGANGLVNGLVSSSMEDGVVGTNVSTGTAQIRISDVRQVVLPLTGMPVKTAGIIAGIVIAVISSVAYAVNRLGRKDDEDSYYRYG